MDYLLKLGNRLTDLWDFRELLVQLTVRDLLTRYKGSYLGFAWALLNPLFMLCVYSFIFIVVFKLKWGVQNDGSHSLYTLMIFCGLIPFYIFSESITRSLGLIAGSPNYVKKVVFPLEVLPMSVVASTCINNSFALLLLIIGKLVYLHTPNVALLLLPLVVLPVIILSLGLSLAFAALGAYVRDLTHTVSLVLNVLFYMSPIFYQSTSVPLRFRAIIYCNPLTAIISQWRDVILLGKIFDVGSYLTTLLSALVILVLGYGIFLLLRKGFADVI